VKQDTEEFYENLLRKFDFLFKFRQKYRTLYVKTKVHIVVDGDVLFHKIIDMQHLIFLYC